MGPAAKKGKLLYPLPWVLPRFTHWLSPKKRLTQLKTEGQQSGLAVIGILTL